MAQYISVDHITTMRVLRTLRALRPLRAVSRFAGIRVRMSCVHLQLDRPETCCSVLEIVCVVALNVSGFDWEVMRSWL